MEKERVVLLKEALLSESSNTTDSTKSDYVKESGSINTVFLVCHKAFPLIISGFGNSVKPTFTFLFLNMYHPDNTVFAAVGLGIMFMNIFLRSYITGFNNFMVTQISQAYGAGDYYLCGEILNRNKVIWTILMLPLMVPLFFIGDLLVLIGQDPELSYASQSFVRICMPGFISQLHYDIYRKYLNSIGLFYLNMPIPLVTLVTHVFFWYLFLGYYNLGLIGAGIVMLIQLASNHILIYIVVYYGRGGEYLHGVTKNSFVGWIEIIKEGIPSYFLQFVTTISLEILLLFTGFVSINLVVANTAYISIFFLFFISVIGVQQSSGPMIGNKIGEADYAGALKIIKANIIFGICFGILVVWLLLNFQDSIIRFYVRDEEIVALMKTMLPFFWTTLFLSVYKDILIGILIGLGLQSQTLNYTILSFFCFYMPLCTSLTFKFGMPDSGPWISLWIMLLSSICYYHYLIRKYDMINKLVEASELTDKELRFEGDW